MKRKLELMELINAHNAASIEKWAKENAAPPTKANAAP